MSRFANGDETQLHAILAASRRNNAQSQITGMLLYCDGHFLQILEGDKTAVTLTFDRIRADPRHHGVFKLDELVVQQRQFGDWAMGFEKLNESDILQSTDIGALFEAQNDAIAQRVQPGIAYKILKSFSNGSMPLI
jgi:hypothetical protein